MSVNKVILVGNLGKDPEVRYIDKDVAVANFTMATTERGYTMQNGTVVPEKTEWHNIVAPAAPAAVQTYSCRHGESIQLLGKKPESGEAPVVSAPVPPVTEQAPPPTADDLPF